MVFIIFGLPTTIYKTIEGERWIYGDSQGMRPMTFSFIRQDNLFSDNDYSLERSDLYKIIWYQAIETWRSGRVYSVGN
jgi:hypothetical protein